MNDPSHFLICIVFTILLAICGLYCLIATRNLLRALIGLELITKAVTLFIAAVGYHTGKAILTQSLIITLIIIEVVIIAIAAGIIMRVFRRNQSLDVRLLRNLKG